MVFTVKDVTLACIDHEDAEDTDRFKADADCFKAVTDDAILEAVHGFRRLMWADDALTVLNKFDSSRFMQATSALAHFAWEAKKVDRMPYLIAPARRSFRTLGSVGIRGGDFLAYVARLLTEMAPICKEAEKLQKSSQYPS